MADKVIGVVFISIAGLIYSLERGFSFLSTSIEKAGALAGNNTGEIPNININGFFDNMFVPILLIVGIIFLIYGFNKTKKD